eukprot:CAMPEP_0170469046 /NCGR_PEP_ID=MMETSP0123-20130129/12001_1 /TAXON_ID=182087 /ORGANISM="Favella ehrenbergii, Strain Fehren 1" /LENGTH=129 /DNA_ID=CAMNT_0010735773 /DNA_START=953 /DNA_END=1342 /DNA_ORIENTATION=-
MPPVVSINEKQAGKLATLKKQKKQRCNDPISNVLRTNDKAFKFHKAMNDLLLKTLERHEMDKPILMADKLDIIWDKAETVKEVDEEADRKLYDPEAEFERALAESKLTAEEAKKKREALNQARTDKLVE